MLTFYDYDSVEYEANEKKLLPNEGRTRHPTNSYPASTSASSSTFVQIIERSLANVGFPKKDEIYRSTSIVQVSYLLSNNLIPGSLKSWANQTPLESPIVQNQITGKSKFHQRQNNSNLEIETVKNRCPCDVTTSHPESCKRVLKWKIAIKETELFCVLPWPVVTVFPTTCALEPSCGSDLHHSTPKPSPLSISPKSFFWEKQSLKAQT